MTQPAVVLIADDDEDILNLVAIRMQRAGHEAVQARNGDEALRLATEREPDLCIFDVIMPGRTGYDLLEEFKGSERLAEVPVILLTATVQERDRGRGHELGAAAYMTKPFDPAELDAVVADVLGDR